MTNEYERIIAEVGGPVDECGVCLAIYGVDLDPDEVSQELGCEPTRAHRRGERKAPRSPAFEDGAWFLQVRGFAPRTVDLLVEELLQKIPGDPAFWSQLSKKYIIRVWFGIHLSGWNKGMSLPAHLVERIAILNASLEFDIYAYEEEEMLAKKHASSGDEP